MGEGAANKFSWIPISSGPRDGTNFLAYWAYLSAYGVARWDSAEMCWTENGEVVGEPTHWCALPEPPEAT